MRGAEEARGIVEELERVSEEVEGRRKERIEPAPEFEEEKVSGTGRKSAATATGNTEEAQRGLGHTCMAYNHPRAPHFPLNLVTKLDHLNLETLVLVCADGPWRG